MVLGNDLRHGLEDRGAQVIGLAASVDQALHYVHLRPDLEGAVLDIRLGNQLCYPVANVLLERGIPFLFATGYESWTIPRAYVGIARLRKPLHPDEIADVLFNVMC